MLKAIRWCTASLVAVIAAAGIATADDDSLLEKALAPAKKEAVVPADGELAPPATPPAAAPPAAAPAQPAPAPGALANPAPGNVAVPNVGTAPAGRPAVGGAIGGAAGVVAGGTAVVAAPAPRALFMPGAAVGPFGEPIAFASPRVCIGEALLLKGAHCGAPIGRVVMQVDRLIFDARVVAWADNGVSVVMPTVNMLGPTHGMIHVIRADGVLADTLPIILIPSR